MPRISDKRDRLLNAALELIHLQGYNQTTLADIAKEANVPLGNVYYYFKTKDDLGKAVISERTRFVHDGLAQFDKLPKPQQRLLAYIAMIDANSDNIAEHGCPIGSLCTELNKDNSPIARQADDIIKFQLEWVNDQFRQMGRSDWQALGIKLLVTLQGSSVLANALHNPEVTRLAMADAKAWINSL